MSNSDSAPAIKACWWGEKKNRAKAGGGRLVVYSSGLTVMQCDLGCRFWMREEKKKEPNNPDAEILGGGGEKQSSGMLERTNRALFSLLRLQLASNYTSHS